MKEHRARFFNLPNKLTLSRIFLMPLIVVLLSFPGRVTCLAAMLGFIMASATDLLDGHIARRANMVTSFGKFLDPLADKVLISSVLIVLVALGRVDAWIAIVIICRDLVITGLRAIAVNEGVIIAADRFGKLKTLAQTCALAPLILHYPVFNWDPRPLGLFLLYAALFLTVFSAVNYMRTFYRQWLPMQADGSGKPSSDGN